MWRNISRLHPGPLSNRKCRTMNFPALFSYFASPSSSTRKQYRKFIVLHMHGFSFSPWPLATRNITIDLSIHPFYIFILHVAASSRPSDRQHLVVRGHIYSPFSERNPHCPLPYYVLENSEDFFQRTDFSSSNSSFITLGEGTTLQHDKQSPRTSWQPGITSWQPDKTSWQPGITRHNFWEM